MAAMSSRPSPLPNRVSPLGEIVATAARGGWMGNRGGRLHEDFRIVRAQASSRWICCRLRFRGRKREAMASGYTELFFLDEATAFAAGHRPCFECRREEARAFAEAFSRARGDARPARAGEIDAALAGERRAPKPEISRETLAPGAMVAAGGGAFLFDGAGFRRWRFEGYAPGAPEGAMTLLTPVSVHAAFHAGYRPEMRI